MNFFKLIFAYLYYKIKFPKLQIGFGTKFTGNNYFGKKIRIGSKVRINNSNLGSSIIIADKVFIENCKIGNTIKINVGVKLFEATIGSYTYISSDSIFAHAKIGSFCSIGSSVYGTGANHPIDFMSSSPIFYSSQKQCGVSFVEKNYFHEYKPIVIGNDVWIGNCAIILGGITISDGAVIGAGSVVTKDVPPYAIVAGNPATIIRFRFNEEKIAMIKKMNWYNWDEEKLRSNILSFRKNLNEIDDLTINSI